MKTQAYYRVEHLTRYEYGERIAGSRHLAHLTPRETAWQDVLQHTVDVRPAPVERSVANDYFGNSILRFAVASAHETLEVIAHSVVAVTPQIASWRQEIPWEAALATKGSPLLVEEFRLPSPCVPILPEAVEFVRESLEPGRPMAEVLEELAVRVQKGFTYDPDATSVSATLKDLLKHRRGVCQDFTHFLLSGLRGVGLAARYLSGYVTPLAPADGTPEVNQGAAASHAWLAIHAPETGWIGCDPTNGKLADTEFITLAWGRDFSDVTPLRGVILARGRQQLEVSVQIEPLPGPPDA